MRFKLTTVVVICTDYIGSCKSNSHTSMTARHDIGRIDKKRNCTLDKILKVTTQDTYTHSKASCIPLLTKMERLTAVMST